MVHPDEGLILSSDRVREAHHAGGISQTEQITNSLTGIAQKNGQTLVSAIVANPQAGASGVAYHLTVPPRYLELGDLRRAMNLSGTFGNGALAERGGEVERYYPEIADNNWHDQCGEALETFRSASGSKSSSSTTSGTTRGHRWPPRSASIARAAVSPITSERDVPPGTILSTQTSTRRGGG